jgi:hypothetical protein
MHSPIFTGESSYDAFARRVPIGATLLFLAASLTTSPLLAAPTPTATPAITPTPAPDTAYFLYENFDRTNPPALPGGWATSFTNGAADCTPSGTCALGSNWVTSTVNPYSGPIAAFHDAPGCVTDSNMDTSSIHIPPSSNLPSIPINFVHSFDLEAGRDGGVLEISYDGGCFTDIVAAGGGANYNGTISTAFHSPIAGRAAWTGNSGGYVNGFATMPSSAKGHDIKLRFRLATDCSGSGGGWNIDVIDSHVHVIGSGTPAPSPTPSPAPTPPPTVCSLNQGFDNVAPLLTTGWVTRNNSGQIRMTDWSNGDPSKFSAHDGAPNSYLAISYSTGCGTISNWFLTPPVTLQNGAVLNFWTRTVDIPTHPDRLQLRMSTSGSSFNVGFTATDVGDFTTLLLDINPTYTTNGYPNVWTQFTAVINGLGSPVTGRLGFRYFVENGGFNGPNADYIGIDTLSYNCNAAGVTPTPVPVSIKGNVVYCSPSTPNPISNVVMALSGSASTSTLSDGAGDYNFSSLPAGGNYLVTPSKAALASGAIGINTVDIIAVQRHFLGLVLLSGCRLTAADVNGDASVNTLDVIAVQRFYLGLTSGIANVGRYQFNPTSRSYSNLSADQSNQDYDTVIFGDVASPFVSP